MGLVCRAGYGRPHPTIRKLLLPSGGIPPVARRRSRLALTLAEREELPKRREILHNKKADCRCATQPGPVSWLGLLVA